MRALADGQGFLSEDNVFTRDVIDTWSASAKSTRFGRARIAGNFTSTSTCWRMLLHGGYVKATYVLCPV